MQATAKPIRVPDSGPAQRLHVVAGACSIQGVRRDTNEDSQYISPEMKLFIVADGMGGHAAGEVASRFAIDVLSHELATVAVDATPEAIEYRVHAALDRAHCLIMEQGENQPEYRGAGTTVVFGLLLNHRLYITGVGDSRAYLVRGALIERLTIDDTLPDALLHLGRISADEAKRHHMRNMLISALGIETFDSNQEEIRALDVYHGDRYLLASDGLTDVVNEDRLSKIISQNNDPQMAAEMLTQEALKGGAGDDVTCVVFYIRSDLSHEPPPASSPTIWQRLTSFINPT